MKIHASNLELVNLVGAANAARASLEQFDRTGSRSRDHAWEVTLGGLSKSMTQRFRDVRAATYNQWGVFLSVLFELDPDMIAGPYNGRDDFHSQTRHEFEGVATYSTEGDHRVAKVFR